MGGPRAFLLLLPFLAVGCLAQDSGTTLVSASPLSPPAGGPRTRTALAPATTETAARVDQLGRKILAANQQIGMRPLFRTIGAPQPEIFHIGTTDVVVTEGLVSQCKTDGELAAALCRELGKMVSEREALAGPQARAPERAPPQEVRIGNDGGSAGTPDLTHLAELGMYERERRRPAAGPLPPPEPGALARTYLTRAGFAETDLQAVTPLLQAAAANATFERQMSPAGPATPAWAR